MLHKRPVNYQAAQYSRGTNKLRFFHMQKHVSFSNAQRRRNPKPCIQICFSLLACNILFASLCVARSNRIFQTIRARTLLRTLLLLVRRCMYCFLIVPRCTSCARNIIFASLCVYVRTHTHGSYSHRS